MVGGCSAFPDVQNGLILHAIPFLNDDERPEAWKRKRELSGSRPEIRQSAQGTLLKTTMFAASASSTK